MTDDERSEIAALAEAANAARERYTCAANMNRPPAGTPEATKAAIEYEIIRTEWLAAASALARAQYRIAGRIVSAL